MKPVPLSPARIGRTNNRPTARSDARVGSQTLRNPIKAHVFQLGGVIRIGVARSVPRVPLEMTQSGAIASRAAAVGANAGPRGESVENA